MTNRRPLPDEIYTRRRVAALLVILLVVALVVWAMSAFAKDNSDGSDGSGRSGAGTTATGTATAGSGTGASGTGASGTSSAPVTSPTVPEPTETGAAGASGTAASGTAASGTAAAAASGSEKPEGEQASASLIAKEKCELADLQIRAVTERPSWSVSETPEFFMEVRNPTDKDCVIDLNAEQMRFEVYQMANNQRMWADTDCYQPIETGVKTFEAGSERSFRARWSGTGSAPGQCSGRQHVGPGSYYLHAVIGSNASDAAPFNLA